MKPSEVDLHRRVRGEKAGQQRHQHALPETHRRRDAQPARQARASVAHAGLGLRHLGHQPARGLEIALAVVGERQRAGRARQQPGAEVLFERRDLLADGALRARQLARDGREAAGFDDPDKGVHGLKTVHRGFFQSNDE
jgi:hypothetical protein